MTALLSFVSLFPRILLGFWLLDLVWDAAKRELLLVKVFLAAAAGFGVSSLLAFLWIWSGGSLDRYIFVETTAALLLTVLRWPRRYRAFCSDFPPAQKLERAAWFWRLLMGVGVLLFMFNLISVSFQFPHGRMDAWSNWNVVSRFIYLGGADWKNTFLRNFDHPDYPLMMTISNAITWAHIEKTSIWGPISFHFLVALSTAGLLFSLVNIFKGMQQASLAALFFMMQPSVAANAMSQYADFPFSYLLLAAGGALLLYFLTDDARLVLLSGFFTGLSPWMKNEGFVTVIAFTLMWGILSFQKGRFTFRNYLIGLAVPITIVILFKLFLSPPNDLLAAKRNLLEQITAMERYAIIIRSAGRTLWNLGEGPIPLIGLIILYGALAGRSGEHVAGLWTIGAVILIQLSAYFVVYLITPHDLEWHLVTSMNRLYSHVLPLAFLLFFVWIKSPQELASKES